jgi:hypothetical protein
MAWPMKAKLCLSPVKIQGHELAMPDVDLLEPFNSPHNPVAANGPEVENRNFKGAVPNFRVGHVEGP